MSKHLSHAEKQHHDAVNAVVALFAAGLRGAELHLAVSEEFPTLLQDQVRHSICAAIGEMDDGAA